MDVAHSLDDRTAEVVRSALAAAASGQIREACDIGERGLEAGYDPVALHAMLGALLNHARDFSAAIGHLQAAYDSRPTDVRIVKNLARALVECERYSDAIDVLPYEVVALDESRDLERLRGFAAQMGGNFDVAIEAYQRVLESRPNDWETWNNLGNANVSSGELKAGVDALRRAAELNPGSSESRLNLARAMRDFGDLAGSEAELRALADQFPGSSEPLAELFEVIQMQGGGRDSESILASALQCDPQNVDFLVALGRQRLLRFANQEAESDFLRALELEPSDSSAFLGLADVYEHHRPELLPALLAQAESAGTEAKVANLIRAMLAKRESRYAHGAQALKDLPEEFVPVQRWHLTGQLLDGLGDFEGAFDAFQRMNAALAEEPHQPLQRAQELRSKFQGQIGRMTVGWRDSWAAGPIPASAPAPVFLVGFPRSGTTLLDTMLMGHPDMTVMEERPVLFQLEAEIGGIDAIAGMSEAEVRRAQQRYFELASTYAELREGALLIDKSPLHLQKVPQIYRLFPDARFILALRHPADCVLGCFMAKFRANSAMANFLTLETAAEFYDLTFTMWERGLSLFPVEVHRVVYEEMIEDAEGVLRPLIERLGMDWHAEILDHQRTARARGIITTASYAQVTEPIYRYSVDRWRRYRKHLEPILPTLQPWIEKFGYSL